MRSIRFRTRTRRSEEDELFFDRLQFESYKIKAIRDPGVSNDLAKVRYEEFLRSDPIDP
jgi:hypothetical protein